MPSNAMSLSQLEAHLAKLRAQHGDLDVVLALAEGRSVVAVDGLNINVLADLPWQKLNHPAVVIGLTVDQRGRLQTMPGQRFQATQDANEWNRDRSAAPEDTDVLVWKRFGGEDRGYRVGEKWFVFEGSAERPKRPIQIVTDGVLAWRPLA